MGMADFSRGSIKVCHRLGSTTQGKQRAILMRFYDRECRAEVWKKKTSLKGSGITISEFLTKERRGVFSAARNHFGVSRCWTQEGSIIIALPDGSRQKNVTVEILKRLTKQYPAVAAGASSANTPVNRALASSSPAASTGNNGTIPKRTSSRNRVKLQ